MEQQTVVSECQAWAKWWYAQRIAKLESLAHDSMSVNPFMLPFYKYFHDTKDASALSRLKVAAHLMTGHDTGFGKLIDEKILPKVFGTRKLTKSFRKNNEMKDSSFDDIDHIIEINGKISYLSLKASRWTIQLGQAVNLNRSFSRLIEKKKKGLLNFHNIVIGVYYGQNNDLTDKYSLAVGKKRTDGAADHNIIDLSKDVSVLAGRKFWTWLNNGEIHTQEWVMKGLHLGFKSASESVSSVELLEEYEEAFCDTLILDKDKIDFVRTLKEING